MTDLNKNQFKSLVRRDDVDFNLVYKHHQAHCRHESAVPGIYAMIRYVAEGVGEVYLWDRGLEKWQLQSFGWL